MTFTKKILSMFLSLALLVSVVSTIALSAGAAGEALDLGEDFSATISIPALGRVFTVVDGNIRAEIADETDSQVWNFVKMDDTNAYTIESALGGYMNVGDLDAGLANVSIGEAEQAYHIYSVNDKYVISPVGYDNKAVDVNGVDFNVQYWDFNAANACQQYEFAIIGGDETTEDVTSEDATSEDATTEDATTEDATSDDATSDDTILDEPAAPVEVNYAAGKKYTVQSSNEDGVPVYCGSNIDEGNFLTDGVLKGKMAGFGQVEYQGSAIAHTITLNLGTKRTDIDKIVFAGSRIDGNRQFANVTIEVSTNGKTFKKVDAVRTEVALEEAPLFDVVFDFESDVTAKYVRLTCANTNYVFSTSEIQVIGYGAEAGGEVNPGENENPGDAGFAVVALVAMISLAGAVIVSKKRFN
jgi:hypothetical protein